MYNNKYIPRQGTLESFITTHEMNSYENLKNKT